MEDAPQNWQMFADLAVLTIGLSPGCAPTSDGWTTG